MFTESNCEVIVLWAELCPPRIYVEVLIPNS